LGGEELACYIVELVFGR